VKGRCPDCCIEKPVAREIPALVEAGAMEGELGKERGDLAKEWQREVLSRIEIKFEWLGCGDTEVVSVPLRAPMVN
jgi:hypothetical protein